MIRYSIIIFLALTIVSFAVKAQLSYTGFEGLADEAVFTRNTGAASWTGQGFTVPWVNGFDQNRAYIDNAYARFGSNSLRVFYPVGQFGPPNSGAQAPLMVTPASQYYISYWFRVSDNFSWGNTSEGGKLPGLGGGARCSGCAVCTGSNGFTARLMWRPGGRLVLYLYHLDKSNPPCGDNNTLRPGGVDYYAPKGQWIKITQRVKVNTGTNHDGEVEVWVNDQQALLRTGLQFVSNGNQVDNLYFSTFHGGNDNTWAPTVDSYIWFDDIKISTNASDIFTALDLNEDVEVADPKKNIEISTNVKPNPVKGGSYFSFVPKEELSALQKVEWLTTAGNIVNTSSQMPNPEKLPVPDNLPSGVYLLKFYYAGKIMVVKIHLD